MSFVRKRTMLVTVIGAGVKTEVRMFMVIHLRMEIRIVGM